ncbi:MAG: hypothetical protein WC937_06675 [Candidatus Omnitrophota bacterium]|jgi:hypothetical protein|nr:hypothetical protein [Candidatus Omnitrophota bacterium]
MKKILVAGLFLCFTASLAFAQPAEIDDSISINGVIIDVQNASKNMDNLEGFVNTYKKTDALAPEAVTSGYGIFLADDYMEFDSESNARIVEFLNRPDSTLEVTIKANVGKNDILSLISVRNK